MRRQIVLEVTVGSESFLITADRTLRELDQALRRLDGVRAAAVKFAFAGTNRTALCNPHIDPEEPTRIMPSVTVALADVNHTSRCNPAVASPECRNRLRGLNGLAVANADDLKDYVIDFDVLAAPDPPAFAVRVHENTPDWLRARVNVTDDGIWALDRFEFWMGDGERWQIVTGAPRTACQLLRLH